MIARPFYETVYHRDDWTLADAFRPQPGWGSRVFATPGTAFGEHTQKELIEGAKASAPPQHRLTRLSIYPLEGPERIIWSTPPDARFAPD